MDTVASSIPTTNTNISFAVIIMGVGIAATLGIIIHFVLGASRTRPSKSGFYGGPITKSSNLSCGRMSSEAEKLYSLFASKNLKENEESVADLRDLKILLSKLCCFKQDLTASQKTITATKELGFATHQDIQPLGDLTGRCFNKTMSERDLSLQFIKWREAGKTLIHRLCTDSQLDKAEDLFMTLWKDVNDVANKQCIRVVSKDDPEPSLAEGVSSLKVYDGLY